MPARPRAPATHKLLKILLEESEEYALFLMAPDGTVTDWFRGAQHIFGYTAQEIVGEQATRLFNKQDIERGADKHEFHMATAGGRAEDDRWHVRKDGTRFWGSGVLFALRNPANELVGFAKIVRNRTDLRAQTEALENQIRGLVKADRQKNLFLGVLAHELRNPLTALINAVELIRQSGITEPMSVSALGIIDRQAAVLRRLVEDLMDTTRVGAGKMELQRQVFDLKDAASAAGASLRPRAQARRQEYQEVFIETPVLVNGDPMRLQQVFSNLLDNAIKYTPERGKIIFDLTTEGGEAVARMEDTGIGMSADILPKVFDVFTQEESSLTASQGGLGLGLPLVRRIVELHGGTVQGRSDGRDKGSVFTVRVPLHAPAQP